MLIAFKIALMASVLFGAWIFAIRYGVGPSAFFTGQQKKNVEAIEGAVVFFLLVATLLGTLIGVIQL